MKTKTNMSFHTELNLIYPSYYLMQVSTLLKLWNQEPVLFLNLLKKFAHQISLLFDSSVKQRFLKKIVFELLEAFCRHIIFDNNLTVPRSKNGGRKVTTERVS